MSIDWITVSAQIVNFLILVWLLKRFLYKPVMEAMDKREQRIADRLKEAQQREQQAAAEQKKYDAARQKLDSEQDQLMQQARQQADQERHARLEEARQSLEQARQQWRQQVKQEQEEFLQKLAQQAARSVQNIARKALTDLADVNLEQQIINQFIDRLRGMDPQTRQELAEFAQPLQITTSFELQSEARERLQQAANKLLKQDLPIEFNQTNELICGITLTAGGLRLSWNLNDYLEQLQGPVREALEHA